jgi:hypothetical protein
LCGCFFRFTSFDYDKSRHSRQLTQLTQIWAQKIGLWRIRRPGRYNRHDPWCLPHTLEPRKLHLDFNIPGDCGETAAVDMVGSHFWLLPLSRLDVSCPCIRRAGVTLSESMLDLLRPTKLGMSAPQNWVSSFTRVERKTQTNIGQHF